jgi:hypothetical protein
MYAKQKRSKRRWHSAGAQGQHTLGDGRGSNTWQSQSKKRPTLQDLHHAAAGAIEVLVITPAMTRPLLAAAAADDRKAQTILMAIMDYARHTHDKPKGQGRLCLDCKVEFPADEVPLHFMICLPAFAPQPQVSLVTGICASCAARGDLADVVTRRLREIWPSATPHSTVRQ